jgi:hypothetical protein
MKIGIIGLLPDQENQIRKEFPTHALEFLPKERSREAKEFAVRHSKVVLMTKFIGHSTQEGIPTHKRVMIHGGMTKLRAWINTQASAPVTVHHAPAQRKETTMTNVETKIDYKALLTAPIGQALVWKRPARTTIAKWEKQVGAMRSYYKRKHGVETELEFKEGSAVIKVISRADKQTTDAPVPEISATAEVIGIASERQFWEAVVVARMGTALPVSLVLREADAVLEAARERFGKV